MKCFGTSQGGRVGLTLGVARQHSKTPATCHLPPGTSSTPPELRYVSSTVNFVDKIQLLNGISVALMSVAHIIPHSARLVAAPAVQLLLMR